MGRRNGIGALAGGMAMLALAGCLAPGGDSDGASVTRARLAPFEAGPRAKKAAAAESAILGDLEARRSVLPTGSPFAQVAGPVLAANSRAAESELRAARLRAEAQSKNWLPTLGPSISLSSLGDVLAGLVIDAVIFDNGRKRAEREFARADVEVAAVSLAIDTNERLRTALDLYLDRQEAREKAALFEIALKDMTRFEYIMDKRVRGGVSDLSDLGVVRHKLARARADHVSAAEAARAAAAELNAMSVKKLDGVQGLADVRARRGDARPLSVMLAEAEKARAVAGAKIERAGFLPGLRGSAEITKTGVDTGASLAPENGIGFGTAATLRAIKAAEEAAGRRVSQANEAAERRLAAQEAQLAALGRQVAEAGTLAQQARANLDLFQSQYDAGQRQVLDVIGVYETWLTQEEARIALKYEMAKTRLDLARELGLLADGSDI